MGKQKKQLNAIDSYISALIKDKIEPMSYTEKTALAKKMGVSTRTVDHWRVQARFPGKDKITKLLDALSLPPLIGRQDNAELVTALLKDNERLRKALEDIRVLLKEHMRIKERRKCFNDISQLLN